MLKTGIKLTKFSIIKQYSYDFIDAATLIYSANDFRNPDYENGSLTTCKIISEKVARQAEMIIKQKGVGF